MSRIKDFSACVFSGTVGFLIRVEGQVNCGMLEVEPTLDERDSPSINPTILELVCYPASDATPETFRKASFSKNLDGQHQYTQVIIYDQQGSELDKLEVKYDC